MKRATPSVALAFSAGLAAAAWAQPLIPRSESTGSEASKLSSAPLYDAQRDGMWYRPGRVLLGAPEPLAEKPAPPPPPRAAEPAPAQRTHAVNGVAIPTGDKTTSGLWLEKVVPVEVLAGAPFEYELRATNLTNISLDNVTVWDTIPQNFRVASMIPNGETGAYGTTWKLGALAPRETKVVKVNGVAMTEGTVDGCAGGSYTTAMCTSIAVVRPAIQLTSTIPAEAILCDPIPVRLVVTNSGSGAARNVRVTQPLPAGLRTADGRTALDLDAGTLAPGQSREFTYNLRADKTGTYRPLASALADGGVKAEAAPSSVKIVRPVLTLTKKGPERLYLGRDITYDIVVTNVGDAAAVDTVIQDILPRDSVFVNATQGGRLSDGSVNWALGTLAPNASKTVSVTLSHGSIGEVKSTATAKAVCAEAATASAATQMAGIPALLLDGVDSPDPVRVGDSVVYTLHVTNQGSAPLTNVRLVCTMDEYDSMEYESAGGATQGMADGRTVNFVPIARLDPKQKATYRITVKALKEGLVQFRAEVVSNEITRALVKVETTNFYK